LPERICAVIVTFNNAGMLEELLNDLHLQSRPPDRMILVDNASRDQTESMVKSNYPAVEYVRLHENLGSAGGYHEGVSRAVDDADFIYTLDDDVQLMPDTLSEIIKGIHALDGALPCPVAAVRSVGYGHPERIPTRLAICPWRGTLFKTEIVRKAGLPSPDYFMYGEDLEYSLRLAKGGYCFYWIPASICRERRRFRDGKSGAVVFGKRGIRYQDPFRLYYAFRNEIFIYRQYHYLLKLFRSLLYAGKVMAMILLSEGWGGQKAIRAVCRGLWDGFGGKLGKDPDYLPT
jgi:rhamnopyranosyl-N-acetylglucosaminyl-diphospho-decaprenol beta-1,3/1,4-galactofuranosyltransferase